MLLASRGDVELVELLLRQGANLTQVDSRQQTAVDYAKGERREQIVQMLVEAGGVTSQAARGL